MGASKNRFPELFGGYCWLLSQPLTVLSLPVAGTNEGPSTIARESGPVQDSGFGDPAEPDEDGAESAAEGKRGCECPALDSGVEPAAPLGKVDLFYLFFH